MSDTQTLVAETTSHSDRRRRRFEGAPFIVIWEVTRACDLACLHCRAEAVSDRHPLELSLEEGKGLIDQVAEFGHPLFVLTGGDPLKRNDIFDLVAHAKARGLHPALAPSATPLVTPEALQKLKTAGLSRLAFSLDGSTPDLHDAFRRVPGAYYRTLEAIGDAQAIGLPVQINTTMTHYNLDDFDNLVERVQQLNTALWSVFFLVQTGRGQSEDDLTPDEYEGLFHRLADLARDVPFPIKTTEAPAYRRVVVQQRQNLPGGPPPQGRVKTGVGDGRGFVFISHTGDVNPSGFLPLSAGNIRTSSLSELYRNAPLFKELRDVDALKGKCGRCEYRAICGGSRARAYAFTGDYMESDPSCT